MTMNGDNNDKDLGVGGVPNCRLLRLALSSSTFFVMNALVDVYAAVS